MTLAIGVISGTSMDGIDVAAIDSDGESVFEVGAGATYPYPDDVAARLRETVGDPVAAAGPLEALEREVTDAHVAAVEVFLREFSLTRDDVSLVGLHGQTVLHRPEEKLTRQLCDGERAANRLGIDVVCDFRSADVAAGGEGAPLVPLYHAAIAEGVERPVAFLNWGGVGNVTYLGPDGEIVAFDTGPANAPLDDFVRRRRGDAFDRDGALAASGTVQSELVAQWLRDPYFQRPAPKSLDRNHFAELVRGADALSDADGAATLAAFTVEATAAAVVLLPAAPRRWIVCGGGRRNAVLMAKLKARLGTPVEPIEEALGYDGDTVEAACFAFLAQRSVRGLPLSLPTTTGVPGPTLGGALWPAAKKRPRG